MQTAGFTEIDSDASVALDAAQVAALDDAKISVNVPDGDTVTFEDTAVAIEAFGADGLSHLPDVGVDAISATDGSVSLTVELALALEDAQIAVTVPPGFITSVSVSGGDLDLTSDQISRLPDIGVSEISSAGSLNLTVDEALALEQAAIIAVSQTGVVSLTDTPAAIESLTPDEIFSTDTPDLSDAGVQTISAGADITLQVAQGLAIVDAGLSVADKIEIADTAANIEDLQPSDIFALSQIGVTSFAATDADVALSVEQAEELAIDGLTVTAPAGDTVLISDTAANIESLPANLIFDSADNIAMVGVTEIDSDGSLVLQCRAGRRAVGCRHSPTVPQGDTITLARLSFWLARSKAWVAGTSPAMTPSEFDGTFHLRRPSPGRRTALGYFDTRPQTSRSHARPCAGHPRLSCRLAEARRG